MKTKSVLQKNVHISVQLLHKLVVRAVDSSQKLLTVIKNPVSNYLPVGSRKFLMTFNTDELILPNKLISTEEDARIVVVIGCIAKGKIVTDYTDRDVKISNYPLSAALTCAKITSGLEEIWGIV
ncbi:Nep1 ribosome biogenesis protein [Dictyocaulus viviparus]|uniref:Nep1 ribosome biogenesis protein n=1 Tax=Dictyocaulus viviparus TaxID=29172 RepID=A0A0D8X7X8_DICVI|nr:Nep1 ribosome biogenesis protein [Dictyocaulus viviparus]